MLGTDTPNSCRLRNAGECFYHYSDIVVDEQRMTLATIIGSVESREKTLTLFNTDVPGHVFNDIETHFGIQNVTVRREQTERATPRNFAVLHQGDEYLATSSVAELRRTLAFEGQLLSATDLESFSYPEVLRHVDDTMFTAYGKRRMILASREIEQRAWRTGDGELHARFQRLSLLEDQWDMYNKLVDGGTETHVYGVSDWDFPDSSSLVVHDDDVSEIRNSWFVVFDAPETGADCVLFAEERKPNRFYGFWTYDSDTVSEILSYLRATYAVDDSSLTMAQ
jgi:hypothetical protein